MTQPLWLKNLAAYSAQVALLVVTGALLPSLFRLKLPRVMLAYWQTLLAVCLVLPLAETWKPVPPPQTTGLVTIQTLPVAARPAAPELLLPDSEALAWLLALGMVGRLGWLALGLERLRRYRRRARRLVPLPPAVKEITSRLGLHATFYVSEETDSPITFGRLNPAVLFPSRFLGMDTNAQRAIACHELIHVERRDWVWNLAEEFILALFWFHPAVWWLVARIRLAREQVVDSEVLRLTRERKPYLNALLEIASGKLAPNAAAAPFFLGERQLAQRVTLMVKEVSMSRIRLVTSLIVTCVAAFLMGRLAVHSFPLRVQAHESAPTPQHIESQIDELKSHPATPESEERMKLLEQMSHSQGAASRANREARVLELLRKIEETRSSLPDRKELEALQKAMAAARPSMPTQEQLHAYRELLKEAESNMVKAQQLRAQQEALKENDKALKEYLAAAGKSAQEYQNALKEYEAAARKSAEALNEYHVAARKLAEATSRKAGEKTDVLRLAHFVRPLYPPRAKKDRIEGNVTLDVTVDKKGDVIDIRVIDGPEALVKAALDAVKEWKYEPPALAPVHTTVTVNFVLDTPPPAGQEKPGAEKR